MCFDFDDFFDEFEVESLAWVGGAIGYFEEEAEERERKRREDEQDLYSPPENDPFP